METKKIEKTDKLNRALGTHAHEVSELIVTAFFAGEESKKNMLTALAEAKKTYLNHLPTVTWLSSAVVGGREKDFDNWTNIVIEKSDWVNQLRDDFDHFFKGDWHENSAKTILMQTWFEYVNKRASFHFQYDAKKITTAFATLALCLKEQLDDYVNKQQFSIKGIGYRQGELTAIQLEKLVSSTKDEDSKPEPFIIDINSLHLGAENEDTLYINILQNLETNNWSTCLYSKGKYLYRFPDSFIFKDMKADCELPVLQNVVHMKNDVLIHYVQSSLTYLYAKFVFEPITDAQLTSVLTHPTSVIYVDMYRKLLLRYNVTSGKPETYDVSHNLNLMDIFKAYQLIKKPGYKDNMHMMLHVVSAANDWLHPKVNASSEVKEIFQHPRVSAIKQSAFFGASGKPPEEPLNIKKKHS